MSVADVNSTSGTSNSTSSSEVSLPKQTLGQDDFLKLLVTQLSSQDPMNPMQDTQFIAQMAQFTSLEQTKAIQSDIEKMHSDQQLLQANALIGRTVSVETDQGMTAQGVVSAVQMANGTPKIVVNDQAYDMSQLLSVTSGSTQ